ncbi:hypothetical protein I6F09_25240 [Bradyrhizobium sp. IC3195]|uniref:hypothetical protein n=1 Tax=Bradyrhizobium sp. IC3195 TaxID=2793804 RepID=UPI001CD3CED7|nr:hypothetical protein [Bradyrhizobium sp. IC3195]MCA1471173.1 hypothetical protein [Bradyrhizobium sp. IC3195]
MPASNAAALIGLALTAAGFAFGLYQYRMNSEQANLTRQRERALAASDQTKEFFEDGDVRFVMRLLDYGNAQFWKEDTLKGQTFDVRDLPTALAVHWKLEPTEEIEKKTFTDRNLAVRSAFDNFLLWLERIEHLIRYDVIGTIGFGELFSYWLVLLGEIPQPGDRINHLSNEGRAALWEYIRAYEFNSVVRLFARYGRAGPVGRDGFLPRKTISKENV